MVNINLTKEHMKRNEYCTQTIYVFGASEKKVALNENNYWYDFGGNKFYDWDELKSDHEGNIHSRVKRFGPLVGRIGPKWGNPGLFQIKIY